MEKIWLDQYPEGVPAEINPDVFSSIVDLFEQTVKKYRNNHALYNMGTVMSYGQLEKKTRDFAAYLQQYLKLQQGDRLGIMLPNSIQYFVAMLGALRAGLIVVNINPLYTVREFAHQINDSGAKTVVVMESFVHVVQASLPETSLENVIISDFGDMFPTWKSYVTNFVARHIKKVVPDYNLPNAIHLRTVLRKGRRSRFIQLPIHPSDVAFLQYTGGTTGVSKGAILTHRNILANVEQAYAWMEHANLVCEEEVIVTALPLYHIFALMANCFAFMKIGVLNILITNPRDIAGFIREMSKHRFTIITGVNTLFKAMMRHKNFSLLDFSHLKIALGGGMSVHRSVAEKWLQITGIPLLEAYGLTEASPLVCCGLLHNKAYAGNIGLPAPSTEIKVIDKYGRELGVGEAGELCVRGPQVMLGYWNKIEETEMVLGKDGWLKTGDIVVVDEQGYISIVDRKKDIIVVSGYNVYPNEVEEVLSEHESVLEVAVIGEPSEKTGEMIKAFIVRKNPSLNRAALMAFCRERLTTYKIPRRFEFCDELPKSNVGKILRRVLREERFRAKNVQ